MTPTYSEVESKARHLSDEERAQLVNVLLQSLHGSQLPEEQAVWAAEIQYRLNSMEQGSSTRVLAEEVFAKARRITGQ